MTLGELVLLGGSLHFQIHGLAPGEADRIEVPVDLQLGGGIVVDVDPALDPPPGVLAEIITAAGPLGIEGGFDAAVLRAPGLSAGKYLTLEQPEGPGILQVVVRTLGGGIIYDDPDSHAIAGLPSVAEVGDMNSDAFLDVVLAMPDPANPSGAAGTVLTLLNGGVTDGVWRGFTTTVIEPVGRDPRSIALRDFDGDGSTDIVVSNDGDGNTTVLLSNGASQPDYTLAATVPISGVIGAIELDGVNGPDLVIADRDPNQSTNDGVRRVLQVPGADLTFDTPQNPPPLEPMCPDPGCIPPWDADMDGDEDVVVVYGGATNPQKLLVLLNDGAGTLSVRDFDLSPGASGAAVRDLNGDGFSEVVVSHSTLGTISVFRNATTAPGGFDLAPASHLSVGENARSVAAVDADDDGDVDIAVLVHSGSPAEPRIQVLRQDAAGAAQIVFNAADLIDSNEQPVILLSGDLDLDGREDMITINNEGPEGIGERRLNAILNTCPGDRNGDRVVNVFDLLDYLDAWFTGDADINFDGTTDVFDLLQYLDTWFVAVAGTCA